VTRTSKADAQQELPVDQGVAPTSGDGARASAVGAAEPTAAGPSAEPSPEAAAAATPAAQANASGGPLYILTNRGNLAYWLSSGVIGPLEQFSGEKYWDDLLSLVPGRLAVFSGPLGSAVDAIPPEDPGQFPVALELRRSALEPMVAVADTIGQTPAVWWSSAWIPTSEVARVIFRSEEEHVEYAARDYANLPPAEPAAVEPELLATAGSLTSADVRTLLADAASTQSLPEHQVSIERLRLADRCSGAVCMALAALPADPTCAKRLKWTSAVNRDVEGLAAALRSLLGKTACSAPGVLEACLATVAELRRSRGWDPRSVLDGFKENLHATVDHAHQERFAAQLDYVDRILNMEARLDLDDSRLRDSVLTALMVFLLHPAPGDALSWTKSAGTSSAVRILTAALVGLAEGMTRLDRGYKPRPLMTTLVSWYLDALAAPGERPPVPKKLLARFVPSRDIGGRLEVMAGVDIVASHERPSLTDALLARDLADESLAETLLAVCQAMGWEDCVVHELAVRSVDAVRIGSVDHISFIGRIAGALEAHLFGAAGNLVVRFKGSGSQRSYVDEPALRHRLETDGLSADVAKRFQDQLR